MRLITHDDLAKLQSQDPHHPSGPGYELPTDQLMVLVKFFTPDSNWTWYAVSASQDPESSDVQFFGLVDGFVKELGYFWLSELESLRGPMGLRIERDLYWELVRLSELL